MGVASGGTSYFLELDLLNSVEKELLARIPKETDR